MLHPPPHDAGVKGDSPSTPCATWVLGWKCPARINGVDTTRVCAACRPRLPPPPYEGHPTLALLVYACERAIREEKYPPPGFGTRAPVETITEPKAKKSRSAR